MLFVVMSAGTGLSIEAITVGLNLAGPRSRRGPNGKKLASFIIFIFTQADVMVFISIADPDPHSICPLNPDPASECGSASSY